MINQVDYPAGTAEETRALKVRFFGVGDGGCRALEQLERKGFPGAEYIAANTDAFALRTSPARHKLVLGARTTRGLGAGGDMQLGHTAAQEALEPMRQWCKGADLVFFVTGLGGGTGSGATPVLARLARECEAFVIVLATVPFDFETAARHRNAGTALDQLKAAADAVITLPLPKLFKLVGDDLGVERSFTITYELLGEAVDGVRRLVEGDHSFKLDFATLRSAFRARHAESAFATVEAAGADRGREILRKLGEHPLLDHGRALADATAVVLSFSCGGELALQEIRQIMDELHRQCPQVQPMFGALRDATLEGRLRVTAFVARHASARHSLHGPVPSAPVTGSAPVPAPVPVAATPAVGSVASRAESVVPHPAHEVLMPALTGAPAQRMAPVADEPASASSPAVPAVRARATGSAVARRKSPRPEQQQLPLEAATKGRFERCEPTLYEGADLDIPTFSRRGTPFN